MASVWPLGIHKLQVADFLIAEGILPSSPVESDYRWETIHDTSGGEDVDDELLITQTAVVWLRGSVLYRIFRFEVEGEPISHAAVARFPLANTSGPPPSPGPKNLTTSGSSSDGPTGQEKRAAKDDPASDEPTSSEQVDAGRRSPTESDARDDRALVVVFRSQAHLYFLSGPSHVVHLPFEVAAIHPMSYGLVLERKIAVGAKDASFSTPLTVPFNSFAAGSITSLNAAYPPEPWNLAGQADLDDPFLPMLRQLHAQSVKQQEPELPCHFCLTDPLAEMGIVVGGTSTIRSSSRPSGSPWSSRLPATERIIYLSQWNEMDGPTVRSDTAHQDVLLAVTFNVMTGLSTVWSYGRVRSNRLGKAIPKRHSAGGKATRRTSQILVSGTGTTTPNVRASFGLRDSMTASQSFGENRTTQESQSESNLASQLDPAFEEPGQPVKASRRVSSLLARSDLASAYERSIVAEHPPGPSSRRNVSLGSQARSIAAHHTSSLAGARRSIHEAGISWSHPAENGMDLSSEKSAELESYAPEGLGVEAMHDLQSEIGLTKIYTTHGAEDLRSGFAGYEELVKHQRAFVLPSPRTGQPHQELVLCIMNRQNAQLSILQLKMFRSSTGSKTAIEAQDAHITLSSYQRSDHILDASKISSGNCSRILALRKNIDGADEITLEAPWSVVFKISNPSSFLYQLPSIRVPLTKTPKAHDQARHSGGPTRVIHFDKWNGNNRIDLVDEAGIRHRLKIQLLPENSLVAEAIQACESVLPSTDGHGEIILRAWWEICSWLRSRPDELRDVEWTAFVVVLFVLFSPMLEPPTSRPTSSTKRNRAGYLRSSSGANVDLSSWDAMMMDQGASYLASSSIPADASWSWAMDHPISVAKTVSPAQRMRKHPHDQTRVDSISSMSQPTAFLPDCVLLATAYREAHPESVLCQSASTGILAHHDAQMRLMIRILLSLHLLREQLKLDILLADQVQYLIPVLAQLGGWLNWPSWSWKPVSFLALEMANMESWVFDESTVAHAHAYSQPFEPPSMFALLEEWQSDPGKRFMTTHDVIQMISLEGDQHRETSVGNLHPRSSFAFDVLAASNVSDAECVARLSESSAPMSMLQSMPEGIAAPIRAAIQNCQARPLSTWPPDTLALIERDDVSKLEQVGSTTSPLSKPGLSISHESTQEVHSICVSTLDVDTMSFFDGTAEIDRQVVTRMIFTEDQRFSEAVRLLNPLKPPVALCEAEPDWSDTDLLEAQQDLVKVIAMRTLAVSSGRGMLFYSARFPLLTEKFPFHAFTLSCIMRPGNTTVTADRALFTEERVSWAFFHAGVEAGLSISRHAKGIDTSWILYNKPAELNNRHAGFLLALGLNGHLRSIAKWVAFKYLTPKHTMTSIGLLLGLAASYLGTMDTLITRLLSVHVVRMLPPGAAELNLSPLTQTTGIMAIGILYCNTQHRRMSEIMLSEMEDVHDDDSMSPMETLRDEGYRLAAGFSLGYINLGHGNHLKGLHDMHIVERLLALAVGTRRVDIVHILDRATAGATIAVALIFMKTEDASLARKIDVPDTIHQFDYVRPDIFLLRTVAKHLIMWNGIQPSASWIQSQLPRGYHTRANLHAIRHLSTEDMPLFNIVAGLCLSMGLKYAGSARKEPRDVLVAYLDQFMRIARLNALNYDSKLTRIAVRNCQDAVALAAAAVMCGTGDLSLFRRLRALHGREDPDTPFGSHLAAHQAIGLLFLGGGTHTLNTSNIAIASLLCAFYPLFPTSVLDNKSHLQAFRHFWVLAAEPRCLVVRDADTNRPVAMPVIITMRTGAQMEANVPCLLPQTPSIDTISTNDPAFWSVTLDFAHNAHHLASFKRHQSIFVRRRGAYDVVSSAFGMTLQTLNSGQSLQRLSKQLFAWIFTLPSFRSYDRAERDLVLPINGILAERNRNKTTVVDDRLVLERGWMDSTRAERLWNLRVLFAWAEASRRRGRTGTWLSNEVISRLKAAVSLAVRDLAGGI